MKGFGYLVKEGVKNVWSNRIMSIASICVLVSCLVLTGAAALMSLNVSEMVDAVGQNNEITVYIKEDLSQIEAKYVGRDIEKMDNIKEVIFVPSAEALAKYKEQLGDQLFERLGDRKKVLPDAFRVQMLDLSKYDDTVRQIKALQGVDTISDRREFAKKLTKVSNLVNIIAVGVVVALIVISLFIIANTIRATMYSRRFEISIMKSVGATNMFVRMPFLIEGMVIGFISAALSTGALALLYNALVNVLVRTDLPIDYIPFARVVVPLMLAFIIVGVLVGFFGGFISIRKYLKKEGNEILGW
ncbi:MAG: permease-like cell division protein FtsX [Ruminococcus sp.]|nr:permease-like cell division protein FtsX [Ruminococcus sp.]